MVRRHITVLALALATFALAACSASPTGPDQNACAVQAGSGICQTR